ncbi:MAG: MarR family winged helix-turn-helix transcriptional regulator [Armatimonadetes bacterium]|nr:MarR family winged helix-turn-helix transcriptional regulator [Armatimonadota bacterium]MCA1995694.1 MarR family winged helix-turn-helix transcriptional regulator [Armatimonadota bacterium]
MSSSTGPGPADPFGDERDRWALALTQDLLEVLRDAGITTVTSAVLFSIVAQRPGISPVEAADKLGIVRFSAYKAVADLSGGRKDAGGEGRDLIEQRVDPDDVRRRELFLTPKGKRVASSLNRMFRLYTERMEMLYGGKAKR